MSEGQKGKEIDGTSSQKRVNTATKPKAEERQALQDIKFDYSISKKKPLSMITAADVPPGLDPEDVALLEED